jgi:hypothetical protein
MTPDPSLLSPLRKLYPHLTDAELLHAETNLHRYLTLVLRIFDRVKLEHDAAKELTRTQAAIGCEGNSH